MVVNFGPRQYHAGAVPLQRALESRASGKAEAIAAVKRGNDDHPAYGECQISEAMTARAINAIASNPEIWHRSAKKVAELA